mmetsp:Transcript_22931/g.35394  ORF Transcript_22931/g.35394 Transcript_22931/m.35394 type:complete len:240 (+) Transcript_22931:214-933(+)
MSFTKEQKSCGSSLFSFCPLIQLHDFTFHLLGFDPTPLNLTRSPPSLLHVMGVATFEDDDEEGGSSGASRPRGRVESPLRLLLETPLRFLVAEEVFPSPRLVPLRLLEVVPPRLPLRLLEVVPPPLPLRLLVVVPPPLPLRFVVLPLPAAPTDISPPLMDAPPPGNSTVNFICCSTTPAVIVIPVGISFPLEYELVLVSGRILPPAFNLRPSGPTEYPSFFVFLYLPSGSCLHRSVSSP